MKKSTIFKRYIRNVSLIILSALFYYYDYTEVGIIVFLIFIIDNFYILQNYWKMESDQKRFIEDIDKSISDNLCSLPVAIVLINKNGDIVWHNRKFNEIGKGEELISKHIVSIARGLRIDKVLNSNKSSHQRLKLGAKIYDVRSNKINEINEEYHLIYFNDISTMVNLDKTKESIMLVEVDNLNEALDTTEEINRPLVGAEVERCINSYAHNLNAMIKKYDNNKYVLSVNDRNIDKEIEDKFPILDEISKINKGNKLEVTLSIGIGRGGISPLENDNFAIVAKELALGRGGDQVVIKNNENIKIFGGNTKEVEKELECEQELYHMY